CLADHRLGLGADRFDDFGLLIDGDYRGLANHDALAAHMNQRICRAQVDPQVAAECAKHRVEWIECQRVSPVASRSAQDISQHNLLRPDIDRLWYDSRSVT